ncbi:DgyrCDS4792 [Dimorphilus gyrociliatus]|uniref:DgyrCDS4792 n=1 Tax=Dimorphilus gyrociliatus TaxID=2664684 RepID=A0A7I8VHT2_9ANNE|nr:DgyrCDS4792 [Dimorphilus gyrociliatus]
MEEQNYCKIDGRNGEGTSKTGSDRSDDSDSTLERLNKPEDKVKKAKYPILKSDKEPAPPKPPRKVLKPGEKEESNERPPFVADVNIENRVIREKKLNYDHNVKFHPLADVADMGYDILFETIPENPLSKPMKLSYVGKLVLEPERIGKIFLEPVVFYQKLVAKYAEDNTLSDEDFNNLKKVINVQALDLKKQKEFCQKFIRGIEEIEENLYKYISKYKEISNDLIDVGNFIISFPKENVYIKRILSAEFDKIRLDYGEEFWQSPRVAWQEKSYRDMENVDSYARISKLLMKYLEEMYKSVSFTSLHKRYVSVEEKVKNDPDDQEAKDELDKIWSFFINKKTFEEKYPEIINEFEGGYSLEKIERIFYTFTDLKAITIEKVENQSPEVVKNEMHNFVKSIKQLSEIPPAEFDPEITKITSFRNPEIDESAPAPKVIVKKATICQKCWHHKGKISFIGLGLIAISALAGSSSYFIPLLMPDSDNTVFPNSTTTLTTIKLYSDDKSPVKFTEKLSSTRKITTTKKVETVSTKFTTKKPLIKQRNTTNTFELTSANKHAFIGTIHQMVRQDLPTLPQALPNQKDLPSSSENMLHSLHVFDDLQQKRRNVTQDGVLLDRPVTPINDEVKKAPGSLSKLREFVRRRISSRPLAHISVDDQQSLAAILISELSGTWSQLRLQVDDPLLTKEENKELQRRITVHLITVAEQLFLHYIDKAQEMNSRGVFSSVANLSRLKAQISLDANKYFNILAIRRYIATDIKTGGKEVKQERHGPVRPATETLSVSALLLASRKRRDKKKQPTTLKEHLEDLAENIKDFNMEKLDRIIDDLPVNRFLDRTDSDENLLESSTAGEIGYEAEEFQLKRSSSQMLLGRLVKNKFPSAPNLLSAELDSLSVELDLPKQYPCRSSSLMNIFLNEEESQLGAKQRRIQRVCSIDSKLDDLDEISPLIQAQLNYSNHDERMKELNDKLKELEERERARVEEEKLYVRDPKYPQPDSVSIPAAETRRAAARISERVCLFSDMLSPHLPVYNQLLGEIDDTDIAKLDSNLFLGDEVGEVYGEIMRTVTKDYLSMDEDPAIAACVSSMPSISHKKQIVNKVLKKTSNPPWGQATKYNHWQHTPSDPPVDSRGRQLLVPMIPKGEGKAVEDYPSDVYAPAHQTDSLLQSDFLARAYSSWLAWWKQTVNTDDYLKYLSTQESDYMKTIFHLYDSDEDEEDEDETKKMAEVERQSRIEQVERQKSWMAEKERYEPGMWNVQSVLLGGLGATQPESVSKKETSQIETITVPSRSQMSGKTRVFSRRTAKSSTRDLTEITIDETTIEEKKQQEIQKRLESIWIKLHLPESERLDMAIKYSSKKETEILYTALDLWEKATELTVERELIVAKLENFERTASDPNRYFERGVRGSSVSRLKEASMRTKFYTQLDDIEIELEPILKTLQEKFNDVLSWRGRPYKDKIKWDKTEMLHWLQEERKSRALAVVR